MTKKKTVSPQDAALPKGEAALDEDARTLDELSDAYEAALEAKKPAQPALLAEEPLFAALLRRSVQKLWPNDPVLRDFCDHVAPKLSARLAHVAAKGGDFVLRREESGLVVEDRYRYDQSFRAHLVNGLLPVLRIARQLRDWNAPQMRDLHEDTERLFVAGYVLHDWLKLPLAHARLEAAGLTHDKVNPNLHLALVEQIFEEACDDLGLNLFLEPLGGVRRVLHDLIFVACNTQQRWGTLRNLSALQQRSFEGPLLEMCAQLCRLADLIDYVGRTPRQCVTNESIYRILTILSAGEATLVCHHLADNKGILTNLIHNAAQQATQTPERERVPILFSPSGVVYLQRAGAPALPEVSVVADGTIEWIIEKSRAVLEHSGKGMTRGPIGIKVADFYKDLFNAADFVRIAARMIPGKVIIPSKESLAGERYAKITGTRLLDASLFEGLPVDVQVDQLAEWCYACEVAIAKAELPIDVADVLLDVLKLLPELCESFRRVPRENKITGGLGLHWFFAAGHYRKQHAGLDPAAWQERMEAFAEELADKLGDTRLVKGDPWANLRIYIQTQLSFVQRKSGQAKPNQRPSFLAELHTYSHAKKAGRGATRISTVSASPFEAQEQREAAVLFAPQVYTPKLTLHATNAIRWIDPISSTEMMLRQLFMSRGNSLGGKFEGLKVRYLYFYPTYFFSPETMEVIKDLYARLCNVSLSELRRQLVDTSTSPPTLKLDAATLQRLEEVILDADAPAVGDDRMIRMRFPDDTPLSFYFIGLKGGRDPSDSEAWVMPTLLALLMPLCMDVKVVASESPLPLMTDSGDLAETVLLDGAHAFATNLLGAAGDVADVTRINIEQVLPGLQRVLSAYFIHTDANARMGAGGFDYNWVALPALARRLGESAAYACQYLLKWERRDKKNVISSSKAWLYLQYANYIDSKDGTMSIARNLTERYRKFYRNRNWNSNSILRPIAIASKVLLDANTHAAGDAESLIEMVRGKLRDFVERVMKGQADGFVPRLAKDAKTNTEMRDAAIQDFAEYFVRDVFLEAFRGDRAALRGKQLNLIKSACEVIYRDLQAQEKDEKAQGEQKNQDEEMQEMLEAKEQNE